MFVFFYLVYKCHCVVSCIGLFMHVCCLKFNEVSVSVYRLSSLEVDPQWSWHQIWLAENVRMGVVRIKCASTPCRRTAINSRSAEDEQQWFHYRTLRNAVLCCPSGDLTFMNNTCSEIFKKNSGSALMIVNSTFWPNFV